MKTLAARAAALALLALAAAPAQAADDATLERVQQRLALAAGPWCDRVAELGADGLRRCTLKLHVVETGGANAAQFFDAVYLLRPLLAGVDEAELAVVLGHEIAHLVLAHARQRLRVLLAAAPAEQRAGLEPLASLHRSLQSDVHPQAPAEPHDQEFDADALGLVLAMRAGYPASAGANLFERKVGRLPGWEPDASPTHPAAAERAARLRRVAQRACAAIAAGEPLMPAEERLLPVAEYRRDEARNAPGARPLASVCARSSPAQDPAADAAAAPTRSLSATPFARAFTLGGHAADGPCPHCNPR